MKSIQIIKYEMGLNDKELCNSFRNCISYFLSYEELQPFLILEKEKKLNICHSKINR